MVIEINQENFEKEVAKSKIPVIIDFFADWCGPCQMMKPVFEKLSESYKGRLKFSKINTENDPELATKFSVQGIPCLIITKNGKEVNRIVGFMQEDSLKEKINGILNNI
ncbi:Thiol:disulfide interchange protein DsbD [uncultured archaeon]|nr:Thiol:disulfide interchange protein DsbD [uncultured archaeon]